MCGPISPQSINGNNYFLTIVDDYSGYIGGIPFSKKSDVKSILKFIILNEEKKRNYTSFMVVSDGGEELTSKKLKDFFIEKGIKHLLSKPYHPEHNEKAERSNRTTIEATRAILASSKLPKYLWDECFKSALVGLNQILVS
ncbi:hypothetical protein O181_036658 [Austropuccinia psidii MF-1]|uniref:Integrase catalytic domain-containing protein n=1 Tax=Austropuccinia psidii MF-1 TaxID=1389203 RepID=A0A9Q3H9E0_9BASI|nr:hypothetical protein [Austropuccinia psidii MF-1]